MRSIATRRRPFATTAALIAVVALAAAGPGAALAAPGLDPSSVEATIKPGESLDVAKTVHTPAIPPIVDVCLLEDLTGSFLDDIGNLQTPGTAEAIFDAVTTASPDAQFAVAGFQDYPVDRVRDRGRFRLSAVQRHERVGGELGRWHQRVVDPVELLGWRHPRGAVRRDRRRGRPGHVQRPDRR